ncbi:MAG: leucine-rich repeat domain-containing protein [Promethearchaeota archaeon]
MVIKDEPWSKKVWYIEGLIILSMIIFGGYSNIAAMILLITISVIVIGILSIYFKRTESPDIKPELVPSNIIPQQVENNRNDLSYNEDQYQTLRNILNIPTSSSSSNTQQLEPLGTNYASTVQYEDISQAKYVTFEGVQYRVRSKSLKLRNKFINNIADIQGLDKIWHLRKLDLSHNQIVSMKGIEYLPNLRILKLSNNKIQKIENVKNFKKLKKLIIDNNQLKDFHAADLPISLKHINIAKNPIEKFTIYTKATYNKIHFGPKKWFPKQELKRLKKQMRRISKSYKSYSATVNITVGLIYLTVWAVLSFLLALIINLAFWGAMTGGNANYWIFLFTQGSWAFVVGAIGAIFIMYFFYVEMNG